MRDFDCTDEAVHGCQEGRFFDGYYDHYCFLPLYVFCGDQLLVSYLRPSNIDQAKHAWAPGLAGEATAGPAVRLTVRADSGFCRHKMLSHGARRHEVGYIVGLAKNARINDQAARGMALAAAAYEKHAFADLSYGARSWNKERRVIARLEHGPKGANPRYVITNLDRRGEGALFYCARGEMENRIKQQLALFADRTSCHKWWSNQFRLILSSLAYTLIATIRRLGLRGTTMARAQADTIRLKLLKIGAVVNATPAASASSSLPAGPGPSHGSQAQAGITDPFALPTQTHKGRAASRRGRRLPGTGDRLRRETGPTITSPKAPSLKSANRKTRDPASASKRRSPALL